MKEYINNFCRLIVNSDDKYMKLNHIGTACFTVNIQAYI